MPLKRFLMGAFQPNPTYSQALEDPSTQISPCQQMSTLDRKYRFSASKLTSKLLPLTQKKRKGPIDSHSVFFFKGGGPKWSNQTSAQSLCQVKHCLRANTRRIAMTLGSAPEGKMSQGWASSPAFCHPLEWSQVTQTFSNLSGLCLSPRAD